MWKCMSIPLVIFCCAHVMKSAEGSIKVFIYPGHGIAVTFSWTCSVMLKTFCNYSETQHKELKDL